VGEEQSSLQLGIWRESVNLNETVRRKPQKGGSPLKSALRNARVLTWQKSLSLTMRIS